VAWKDEVQRVILLVGGPFPFIVGVLRTLQGLGKVGAA
jgi:hypothetical protein